MARNTRRKRAPTIGTVIAGTLLPEETVPAFADELRAILGALPRVTYDAIRITETIKDEDERAEAMLELANALIDELNEHARPYFTFGTHANDGADFGFWLNHEALDEAVLDREVLKVADTSEVPKDYMGQVLHVNDHGNPTLYYAVRGKLREVWAIV